MGRAEDELQVAPQPSDDRTETDGPRYGLTVSKAWETP